MTSQTKKKARVLFCNPPSPDSFVYIRDINRSGRRSVERTIWPQTSLAMLAGVLQESEVELIDCIAEGLDYNAVYERMKVFAPTWVVINPISSIFVHDLIIAHYAKSLGATTVIISPHAKVLEEQVHAEFPCVDHVISYRRGDVEIEYALRELIEGTSSEGTSFRDLPPARQDLLPTERYSLPFIGKGFTFVIISRGCPFKCIYCRQAVMYEGDVRYRSVDSVVEEITKYNLRNIALHSDTATLNKEWMYEFCEKIPSGVRWICNSRVDTVDLPLLKRMRQRGCWMVCFGIESGDNDVLRLNKKGATCEQAKEAVKWAKEAGLKVWGYFMLGLYGDNCESMERTIRFAVDLAPDIANFAVSAPYPGTEWNDIAKRSGWLSSSPVYDQNYACDVEQTQCPSWLVREFQRRAYLRWYLSWRGFKVFLSSPRFFFRSLIDHIRTIYEKEN